MKAGARLLVVAGEGSGDVFAASVVVDLGAEAFGMGGTAVAGAGTDLVFDARRLAAMGIGAVARKGLELARAFAAVGRAVRARRPLAALLVGFSEFNGLLSTWLRRRGVRVLWYAPPQVWAWRPGRARRFASTTDALAVLLPFESAVWARAGANVTYVGHPALDGLAALSVEPRSARGEPARIALIPGSRAQEVRSHLPALLAAVRSLARAVSTEVVRAPFLDARTAAWLGEEARAAGVTVVDGPVSRAVRGADVAVTASGTATLECVLSGVPPVIVYRTDALSHAVAKRLVRVRHIGLPNLVLERRAFPELVQDQVTAHAVRDAVRAILDHPGPYLAACAATRTALVAGLDAQTSGQRVASLLRPWLN